MKQATLGFLAGMLLMAAAGVRPGAGPGPDPAPDRADERREQPARFAGAQAGQGSCACPGDLNGDQVVNILDLLVVLGGWGACGGCDDQPGTICCDGDCVDPATDPNHCGDCGIVCPPGTACIDGDCVTQNVWYLDLDGDEWGDCDDFIVQKNPREPYTAAMCGDCDDFDPNTHPGALEFCDGIDNDCNGTTDDDTVDSGMPCGSDIGACVPGVLTCVDGSLECVGAIGPEPEICGDGIDNNCDGQVDEGCP